MMLHRRASHDGDGRTSYAWSMPGESENVYMKRFRIAAELGGFAVSDLAAILGGDR